MKLITVVIPVWNRESLIERTLDSFARQDCSRVRIVLVDNNSTDSSVAVMSRWIERHRDIDVTLISESKPGATAARNRGLETVETPYVMFFDSDDVTLPGHLDSITARLDSDSTIDILGWDVDIELKSGRHLVSRFVTAQLLFNHLVHAVLATQHYVVSTSLVKSVGAWDESLAGWNDYELGVRLALSARHVEKLSGTTPFVRTYFTENSITGRSFSKEPAKWERSLDAIESTLAVKCPGAIAWLGYRRAVLAAEYRVEGAVADAGRLLSVAPNKYCRPFVAKSVYLVHRILHRGAWMVAACFLPKDF